MKNKNNPTNNCQEPLDLLFSQMEAEDFGKKQLNKLVQKYPSCEDSLTENFQLWNDLNILERPVPRPEMSAEFYKKLNEFTAQNSSKSKSKTSFWAKLKNWNLSANPKFGWALGIGLFLIGFFSGQLFQPNNQQAQIDALAQEIQDIKNPSPKRFNVNLQQSVSGRMKDIQFVRQMDNPDAKVLNALNKALCNDPNINVRLSAIETLVQFSEAPEVMEILIRAIPKQSSSLVQLELAEVMIQLEEKRSAAAWQELFESGEVELDVKMQLKESLEVLL